MKNKTTIAISCKHDEILSQLIAKNNTNKKQFLEKSIEYFDKYDINPLDDFKAPKDELTKVVKKLDQMIAFIRVQERDILKPACVSIIQSGKSVENNLKLLNDLVTDKNIQTYLNRVINWLNKRLTTITNERSENDAKQLEALVLLAQLLEKDKGKNIQTYIQKLFDGK